MKVLFLLSIGLDRHETSEHLLVAMMEQVCLAGHSVHIIQKDTGGDLPPVPPSLLKYQITTQTIPFIKPAKNKLASRYWAEIKYVLSCKRVIKDDYDAVFIQSTTVAGFATFVTRKKLPKAKITLNIQDIFPYNALYSGKIKNSFLFKIFAAEQRYGYKHSDRIITISEDMKETLVSDGVPEKKIEVVYNWSYQDDFYDIKDDSSVSRMFNKKYFNIVYAGNIGVMQNVDIIVDCANLMKNDKGVWFHIIGNGVYKDRLISKAKEYGISNITFWPIQPPESAPAVYCAADVNIIPLARDICKTALPSKIATCLACQKPIVLVFGGKSIFGNRVKEKTNCQLTSSENAKELLEAIKMIQSASDYHVDKDFFTSFFSKSKNSRRYAEIITD